MMTLHKPPTVLRARQSRDKQRKVPVVDEDPQPGDYGWSSQSGRTAAGSTDQILAEVDAFGVAEIVGRDRAKTVVWDDKTPIGLAGAAAAPGEPTAYIVVRTVRFEVQRNLKAASRHAWSSSCPVVGPRTRRGG